MNKVVKEYYEKSEGEMVQSWEDVEQGALNIIERMKKDNFEPDIIISIARSGLIPASLIAYALGNKELYVIKIDFSKTQQLGKEQDMRSRPKISQELSKDIENLKVLVVDEMVVSGETLKLVSTYLQMKDPNQVKFCVLYKQPWSQFDPDYYGLKAKAWPVFPWKTLRKTKIDPRAQMKLGES